MTRRAADYYHPVTAFLWLCSVLALSMMLSHPLFTAIGLFLAVCTNLIYGGGRSLAGGLKFGLPMLILVVLLNPLANHRGSVALFYLFGNVITLESLLYGICSGAVLLLIFLWFGVYNRLLPADRFLYLFSRFAPIVSLLIVMTQRMIPLFTRRLRTITAAQKTLRCDMAQGGAHERVQNGLKITSALMSWSMEEGLDTADSMKARGYGVARRSKYASYRFTKSDGAAVTVTLMLTSFIVVSYSVAPPFGFFPTLSFPFSPALALSAAGFTLLCLLPLLIELWEGIKCRCLK